VGFSPANMDVFATITVACVGPLSDSSAIIPDNINVRGGAFVAYDLRGVAANVSFRDGEGTLLWGDVNGDGVVDEEDVLHLLRDLAGHPGIEICYEAADVNHDGIINTIDALWIQRHVSDPEFSLAPP